MLNGVRRHDLTGLNPDDALRLFREQGIRAERAEVVQVCEPLGYHPLSLRLLAGYASKDPQNPLDLRAAARYDPTADLLGKRQHILSQAYNSLPPAARETLSRLAAFRGSVTWDTLTAIFGDGKPLRNALTLLEARSLLQRTTQNVTVLTQHATRTTSHAPRTTQYDLHPIVRRYAYARLSDPAGVHAQLVSHFEAVPQPEKVQTLADLQGTIELYHHLARAGKYDEALILYRDRLDPLYYQLGAYQLITELIRVLFPDGEDKLPRLRDESVQAWTLNELANCYSLSGRPAAAAPLFERVNDIYENKTGNKKHLAIGLGNLALDQIRLGQLSAAATNLRRSIDLCREIEDRFWEAVGHQHLGRVLAYTGDGVGAAAALDTALELAVELKHVQNQGLTWAYCALSALLRGDAAAGQAAAQAALRLAEMHGLGYPVERDYVQAYWLLGWTAWAGGQWDTAQTHLDEALRRCRAINLVELEPAILLAQARLARTLALSQEPAPSSDPAAGLANSHSLAAEARRIAERSSFRLYLAEIHNFLAHLALDSGDRALAHRHGQDARDYAWCDGPPYVYQAALEEAEGLLRMTG